MKRESRATKAVREEVERVLSPRERKAATPQAKIVRLPAHAEDAARAQREGEQTLALLEAKPLVVRDAAHVAELAPLKAEAQARWKALEQMRLKITRPLDEAKAEVMALFRPGVEAYKAIERLLATAIGDYQLAQAETERKARELAAKAAAEGKTTKLLRALETADAAAPAKVAGMSTRFAWAATIVAPDLVPREWCTPNEAAINAHARQAGSGDTPPAPIPGVQFERRAIIGSKKP